MVAAYLMVVFAVDLGWPYWLSFLLALAGMALLGAIFNLGVYYPLRHRTFCPSSSRPSAPRSCSPIRCWRSTARSRRVLEGWFEDAGHPARAGFISTASMC